MLKIRLIPCLLLEGRGLVKTVRFKRPKYVGDPINAVKIFTEKEADELIFLDIAATVQGKRPNFEFIRKIASECFMPFSYGGGIRSIADIKALFDAGVDKVIMNTYAIENPNFISEAASIYGSQSIVVAIDVKKDVFGKYKVFIRDGRKKTNLDPMEHAVNMEKMGAGELFLNSIDRDGIMQGYDPILIKKVSHAVNIPVVACGGAGKIEDFAEAVASGASAVSAGSFFVFHGKRKAVLITYPLLEELERILN